MPRRRAPASHERLRASLSSRVALREAGNPPIQPVPADGSVTARHTTLAFAAGFCDAAAFVGLLGLFVAHLPGNVVLLGVTLAGDEPHAGGARLLALPLFLTADVVTHLQLGIAARHGMGVLRVGLLGEAALILLFFVCATAASPVLHADSPGAILAGMVGVSAMGCQNATVREALPVLPTSTAVNMNSAGLVVDAMETARGGGGDRAAAMRCLGVGGPVVAGFVMGAGSGATGFRIFGFACLLVPLGPALAIALRAGRPAGDGRPDGTRGRSGGRHADTLHERPGATP
ncbi:YoaK family protein (plasmid) [Roseomonas sp. CCTCC AB2023176]|uniref:YoaK family protein n=1 Tax=Roseomonas sp. CCTCC AB2023176 TaxID=3342640 RepID=UPI0035DE81BB